MPPVPGVPLPPPTVGYLARRRPLGALTMPQLRDAGGAAAEEGVSVGLRRRSDPAELRDRLPSFIGVA